MKSSSRRLSLKRPATRYATSSAIRSPVVSIITSRPGAAYANCAAGIRARTTAAAAATPAAAAVTTLGCALQAGADAGLPGVFLASSGAGDILSCLPPATLSHQPRDGQATTAATAPCVETNQRLIPLDAPSHRGEHCGAEGSGPLQYLLRIRTVQSLPRRWEAPPRNVGKEANVVRPFGSAPHVLSGFG